MDSTILNTTRKTHSYLLIASIRKNEPHANNCNNSGKCSLENGDSTHYDQIQSDLSGREDSREENLSTSTYDSSNIDLEPSEDESPMASPGNKFQKDLNWSNCQIKVPRLQNPTKSSLLQRRRILFSRTFKNHLISLAFKANDDALANDL